MPREFVTPEGDHRSSKKSKHVKSLKQGGKRGGVGEWGFLCTRSAGFSWTSDRVMPSFDHRIDHDAHGRSKSLHRTMVVQLYIEYGLGDWFSRAQERSEEGGGTGLS